MGCWHKFMGGFGGKKRRNLNLDNCEFKFSEIHDCVVVLMPYIKLCNKKNNLRKVCENEWLKIVDVGHQWTEFTVYDLNNPDFCKFLGSSHDYETAQTYHTLSSVMERKKHDKGI